MSTPIPANHDGIDLRGSYDFCWAYCVDIAGKISWPSEMFDPWPRVLVVVPVAARPDHPEATLYSVMLILWLGTTFVFTSLSNLIIFRKLN